MMPEQLQGYYYKSLSVKNLKKETGVKIDKDYRSNNFLFGSILFLSVGLMAVMIPFLFKYPWTWALYPLPLIGLICYVTLGRTFGWCDVTDTKRKIQKMGYYDYKDLRLAEHLKEEEYIVDDIVITKSRMKELAELCSGQYAYRKPQQNFVLLGICFSILFAIVSPAIGFGLECVKLYAIQEQKPLESFFPYIFISLVAVLFFLFVLTLFIGSVYIQPIKNQNDKAKQYLFLSTRIKRILHEMQFEKIDKKSTRRHIRRPRTKADTKQSL